MAKRPRHQSPTSSEDRYLHAFLLLADHGQPVDTGDLAARVGVSDAAASRMLRALEARGLVRVEPYQGAELTTEGLHRALRIVRRHRLLETYLHGVMGFDLREAHTRAQLMQPTIDQVFEDKLDAMLGQPRFDPHGQPIPSKNATWPKVADSVLTELPAGTTGTVSRVTSDDEKAIAYLASLGIEQGVALAVVSVSPFDGPVAVRVGATIHHVGRRLAQAIHVTEREPPTRSPRQDRAPGKPEHAHGRRVVSRPGKAGVERG